MIEVPVIDASGKELKKAKIDEAILGGVVRRTLLKEAVLMYEANQRVGNAATKTRSDIRASNRKLWRQKGTGRARVGNGTVVHFRGGGMAHGPHPRDFSYAIPKKARKQATKSALLAKLQDGEVKILDKLEVKKPSTKEMANLLKSGGFDRSCLVVTKDYDKNALLSIRNIPEKEIAPISELNAYNVIRHRSVLFTQEAFDALVEKYSGSGDKSE